MSSIPLPALDLKQPAQQPGPLDQYGNLLRLQAMQQENQQRQENAPLQQQAAQQQVQSGALQLQQQQRQLTDQKAMTTAMQQWDGKDLSELPGLVLKNGGSAEAVMGLKQKSLAMQQQYSTIAKNDADAGSANMATMQKKNDLISGALSQLIDPNQTADAALPQALTATAQDLVQKGLLDPQHAQAAEKMAQSGNPQQIRSQLDVMRKSFMAQSQLMQEAKDNASIASQNAETQQKQAQAAYYAKNGGAPGVPAEIQQQNDWLEKNPGKGPSDFAAWKARQSPFAVVMGNQMGGDQNSQALDFAADNYRKTGQMPPGLSRSPGTTIAIVQRAAQLDQQDGGAGIAANKGVLASNVKSLDNLQKNFDQVQAFEGTASRNIDLLQQTAQKIPDLGSRFANVPVRMLNSKMLGTENMAAFNTALNTAQTEAAKVLNSSNASGVLSDSARHELQQIVDGNMPYKSMVASLNTLKQDMSNRTQAYQEQINGIQGRIKSAGTSTPSTAPTGASGLTVTAPNGKTYSFKDQASADKFRSSAGIQ